MVFLRSLQRATVFTHRFKPDHKGAFVHTQTGKSFFVTGAKRPAEYGDNGFYDEKVKLPVSSSSQIV